MALETASNLWGLTVNPFNSAFGAGGSSGGDGALIAMRGAATAPMTDIGGSIRSPAAFNGLYAIRPTADRMPKTGMHSWNPSQMSIRVSCGPGTHTMRDLKRITPVLNGANAAFDISCAPVPWRDVPQSQEKLTFGLLAYDGVVTPHPPVQRALTETVEKLRAAGHEGMLTRLPLVSFTVHLLMYMYM
jgi:amidase